MFKLLKNRRMTKIKLGPNPYLYPMPTVIVGALIDNRPNFVTVSYVGIVQHTPPMVAVTLVNSHFTNKGLIENNCFSINIPNTAMLKITDFIGMNSGDKIDKSNLFEVFYGELKKAPLIMETPLNLECRLVNTLDLKNDSQIFIGEIVQSYSEKKYLKNGRPYMKKLKPIIFSINNNLYYSIGNIIGKAWNVGLKYNYKKKPSF
jgi:flavin reductase (DIM6/NTAB) family NADH-FMN oxidoreductase RutF